jgi:hypothetical protein
MAVPNTFTSGTLISAAQVNANFAALDKLSVFVTPQMYGAVGNGSTDDRAAFVAALATGLPVFVPGVSTYYVFSTPVALASNAVIWGTGTKSRIVCTGTNANAHIFTGASVSGLNISDIHVTPGTTLGTTGVHGTGIYLSSCTDSTLTRIEGSAYRRGVIMLENCSRIDVDDAYCHDSVVTNSDDHTTAGYDIAVFNNADTINIRRPRCIRGAGIGISVQTRTLDTIFTVKSVHITDAYVANQGIYGIMVYSINARAAAVVDDVYEDIKIIRPTVLDITGAIKAQGAAVEREYIYGTGIYIQGVSDNSFVIEDAFVRRTNTATNYAQLGPGGIGVVQCSGGAIVRPNVENCAWFGIYAQNTLQYGSQTSTLFIDTPMIANCGKTALDTINRSNILVQDYNSVSIKGGYSRSAGLYGFETKLLVLARGNYTTIPTYTLAGFEASSNPSGVVVAFGNLVVNGGLYRSNTSNGVYSSAIDDITVGEVTLIGNGIGVRGATDTSVGNASVVNCIFDGNTTHLQADRPFVGIERNTYRSAAASSSNIAGTYGLIYTPADSATPDLKGRLAMRLIAGTTVTTFLNPPLYTPFTVRATGTRSINESGNILLNGAPTFVTLSAGDSITFFFEGSTIFEVGRKIG